MTEITGYDLVAKIYEKVVHERERFDMGVWAEQDPKCGTTACVAGWACVLNGADVTNDLWPDGRIVRFAMDARRLLRGVALPDGLFGWTDDSAIRWLRETTERHRPLEYARIHAPTEPSSLQAVTVPEVTR